MSGDTTYQSLKRLSWLPDRDSDQNGLVIAGQEYYDVEFTGGSISNVVLTDVTINGVETVRNERIITNFGDVTVLPDDYVIIIQKNTPEITTVTFPASPDTGRSLIIKDGNGESTIYPITVDGNGNAIDGEPTDVLNIDYQGMEFFYNGIEWNVLNRNRANGAGAGNVVGPASSTDNALARFDGATGELIQNSNATLTDPGNLTLAGTITASNFTGSSSGVNTGDIYFSVKSYGAVGDGITNDLPAFNDAVAAASVNGGGTVYIPGGYEYKLDGELVISTPGVGVLGDGNSSVILSSTFPQSGIQLRADNQFVENVKIVGNYTRVVQGGSYEGFPQRDRNAGVYMINGSYQKVINVTVENFNVGAEPRGGWVASVFNKENNNQILNLSASGCDFGILACANDDIVIENLNVENTTNIQGAPPHAIYFTAASALLSERVRIITPSDYNNVYSASYKIEDCPGVTMVSPCANTTVALAYIVDCDDGVISDPVAIDVYDGVLTEQSGGIINVGSERLKVSDGYVYCRDGVNATYPYRTRHSNKRAVPHPADCSHDNCFGSVQRVAGSGTSDSIFLTEGDRTTWINCRAIDRGATQNRIAFYALGGTGHILSQPVVRGTNRIYAIAASAGSCYGTVSSGMLQSFSSANGYVDSGSPASVFNLDGAREGTFTPVFVGATTPGTNTYTTQTGRWQRIGKMVYVAIQVRLSGVTFNSTGNMTIQALPFTVRTGVNIGAVPGLFTGFTLSTATNNVFGRFTAGSTILDLRQANGTTEAPIDAALMSSSARVEIAGWYETSDP